MNLNRSLHNWICSAVILILLTILATCAGRKPPIWGTAKTGFKLSYRSNIGDRLLYEKTMQILNTFERGGQSFENMSTEKFVFCLITEKVDTMLSFNLVVDTLGFSIANIRGQHPMNYGDLKGKRARLSISTHGEKKEFALIDSLPIPQMDGILITESKGEYLLPTFFKIPEKLVRIGDSWTEIRRDSSTQNDTIRYVTNTHIKNTKTDYTVVTEEVKSNFLCLHVQIKTRSSTQSWSNMMGSKTNSKGDEEATEGEVESIADVWFAYREGLLVEMSESIFYEGTSAFSGQMSGTTSETSDSNLKLRLLKWTSGKK